MGLYVKMLILCHNTHFSRNVKHELASLATQLAQLGQGKSLSSGGANRRLDSAKRQKENKVWCHIDVDRKMCAVIFIYSAVPL